jgi:hypothetical protein
MSDQGCEKNTNMCLLTARSRCKLGLAMDKTRVSKKRLTKKKQWKGQSQGKGLDTLASASVLVLLNYYLHLLALKTTQKKKLFNIFITVNNTKDYISKLIDQLETINIELEYLTSQCNQLYADLNK